MNDFFGDLERDYLKEKAYIEAEREMLWQEWEDDQIKKQAKIVVEAEKDNFLNYDHKYTTLPVKGNLQEWLFD